MNTVREIPNDVLSVLIEDIQQCVDKEAELIAELIRQNEGGIQEYNEALLVTKENVGDGGLATSQQRKGG